MKPDYLLSGDTAKALYASVAELPIYDYHCHLPPKAIYEDEVFENIGELWLGGDHYKWRLMREAGLPESLITGTKTTFQEKFRAYLSALEFAAGNPLYAWSGMELKQFFGIELPLCAENADAIWEAANTVIREKKLSPRKLIQQSRVALVATTDDPADSLEYHKLLAAESDKGFAVLPSFRPDKALNLIAPGYAEYLQTLAAAAGMPAIASLADLCKALRLRMDFFQSLGCCIADMGLASFPNAIASDDEADATLRSALAGGRVSNDAFLAFLGNLLVFLGREYKARGIVMQWHLASYRNANTPLYRALGPDCGCDCIGDLVPVRDLARVLDAIHSSSGLPETILYALEPAMNSALMTLGGCYGPVRLGAAWWFVDHRRGIENVLDIIAETGHLGSFLGMLTDSRSFLSYARHDYFRRILASFVARLVDNGEFEASSAPELMKRISCENIRTLLHL